MTANPHSIDLSAFVAEHLEHAEPDVLHWLLSSFIQALMSAEAGSAAGAGGCARRLEAARHDAATRAVRRTELLMRSIIGPWVHGSHGVHGGPWGSWFHRSSGCGARTSRHAKGSGGLTAS